MIALVCGGRNYHDHDRVSAELNRVNRERGIEGLIHGAARGADSLAASWMKARIDQDYARCSKLRQIGQDAHSRLWMVGYKADWEKHGKAAGPIRNQSMLDNNPGIELVIAFPGGAGTEDMKRRARARGIEVMEISSA